VPIVDLKKSGFESTFLQILRLCFSPADIKPSKETEYADLTDLYNTMVHCSYTARSQEKFFSGIEESGESALDQEDFAAFFDFAVRVLSQSNGSISTGVQRLIQEDHLQFVCPFTADKNGMEVRFKRSSWSVSITPGQATLDWNFATHDVNLADIQMVFENRPFAIVTRHIMPMIMAVGVRRLFEGTRFDEREFRIDYEKSFESKEGVILYSLFAMVCKVSTLDNPIHGKCSCLIDKLTI
jgi:hypothetical protein